MAGSGIIGTALGFIRPEPHMLLHHYMGDVDGNVGAWGFARGGMGALQRTLESISVIRDIIRDANVDEIIVRNGRAVGVALKDGTEYRAPIVVSNLDPKRTFLDITNPKDLPASVVKKAQNFKIRGSSGKLNIALDGLPCL